MSWLRWFRALSGHNPKLALTDSLILEGDLRVNDSIRFVMLGGFLGAGKTTTIARLARHYQSQGLKVGIVTNDQATDLVDTQSLRSQGFEVGEVPGACFCCNFVKLTETIGELSAADRPDVILAEPVGSCTDLVATVVRPLQQLFGGKFDVAPYGVLVKPSHGSRILRGEEQKGFSPQAAYIFRKQLEEADFLVINRVDQLPPAEVEALTAILKQQYPGTPVLRMSAKTGVGFEALVELFDQKGVFGKRLMDVDYDVYAEGEAELGWLNSSLAVSTSASVNVDQLLLDLIGEISGTLARVPAETAHLKAIAMGEGIYGVANLVSSDSPAELSLPSGSTTAALEVIVNARVAIDPEELTRIVHASVEAVAARHGATVRFNQTQSFRPGRPNPTHRLLEPTK